MPSRTLPTFTRAAVAKHNSEKSCYVTIGHEVYDVTDFVDDHPGGGSLVLKYAGRDVAEILKDEASHTHSEAAYDVLSDSLVGLLESNGNGKAANGKATNTANTTKRNPNGNGNGNGSTTVDEGEGAVDDDGQTPRVHPRTGMSCAEDLTRDTDISDDFKRHRFLDLNRPMLSQVWNGGFSKEFYLDQVHRPRHYKGGQSAPLFGNFLEPLTKTPWWVVPLIWLPCVAFGTRAASEGLTNKTLIGYLIFGYLFFSLIEYTMHRFFFHLDGWLPDNRVGITLHFLAHGLHHYLPMDKYRLVLPPVLALALVAPFWPFAHTIIFWDWYCATATFSGGLFGLVCYDLTHYSLHHENLPLWYKQLKKYHLAHHFLDYENGFGITTRFWDRVFGTELMDSPKTS